MANTPVYNIITVLDPCFRTTRDDLARNHDVHWSTMSVDIPFWEQLQAEEAFEGYVFEEWEPPGPNERVKPGNTRIRIHEQVSRHSNHTYGPNHLLMPHSFKPSCVGIELNDFACAICRGKR